MKKVFKEISPTVDVSFTVKEEKAEQFAAPFHFHDAYELLFIVNGQGKFYGGNQIMNFQSGDIYFFGPFFPHYFVNENFFVQSEKTGHSVVVQFQQFFLGKDLFQRPEFRQVKELFSLAHCGLKIVTPNAKIKKLFFQIVHLKGVKRVLRLLELMDYIVNIQDGELVVIAPETHISLQAANSQKSFSKLDPVYRYVLENFKEGVSLRKGAALAYMNETAFCRYFKKQTNKTFSQFVNHVRVIHATSILTDKNLSISSVCYECGYNNLSYFNRQFKKFMNLSPLEYRKVYTNKYRV
jgi:AraC-like DNA-binding protein